MDSGYKAEVDEHPVVRAGLPHDVARLEIAVHVPLLVEVRNSLAHMPQNLHEPEGSMWHHWSCK
jgi:hypothetical protein